MARLRSPAPDAGLWEGPAGDQGRPDGDLLGLKGGRRCVGTSDLKRAKQRLGISPAGFGGGAITFPEFRQC